MSKRDDIEAVYPLSPVQQGMLFHALLAPGTANYMVQSACVLRGDLKVDSFERAWQQVVDRHASLRTAFLWEGLKDPLQVVGRRVTIRVEQEDWRQLSATEQSKRMDAFLAEDLTRGFKFSRAPLMRLALFRLSDDAYEFVWTHHHLLLDGWSLPLLLRELFLYYEAFSQGRDLQLDRPHSYQNYIAWLQRQRLADAEAYWKKALKGFTTPTPVAMHANGNGSRPQGRELTEFGQLTPTLTTELHAFARENQLTLNTVLQGAWALLLGRYSREDNVVFGATVSGRPVDLPGAESMLGVFINTLPVRVDVSGKQHLIPWLKSIQDAQVEMRQFEYSPLVQVQGWSDVARGRAIFESLYVFENYPAGIESGNSIAGVSLDQFRMMSPTGFPLSLLVGPGSRLNLQLCYDSALFDRTSIRRMFGHIESLLEEAVRKPDQRLRDIRLLNAEERQKIVVELNDTTTNERRALALHALIEAQVERTPDAVAVVFEDEQLTYRELNTRANQLAHFLHGVGICHDTPVGILVERSLEMVVGLLGIMKAGGAYVPLDAEYPAQRLAQMLEDARVPVLLTQDRFRGIVPPGDAHVFCLDRDWATISGEDSDNPRLPIHGDNLAYVIFTSGSTGRPKGAMNTHAGICNRLLWMQSAYGLTPEDRVLQKTPFSFDVSVWEFFWPLLTGARLVVARPGGHRDAAYLTNVIAEEEITTLHFVPSMLRIFLDEPGVEKCRSLKRVIVSGEALPFDLQQLFFSRLKWAELHNLYGPTEAAVDVTYWACRKNASLRTVPIGRPIHNTQIHLLDENFAPVPLGVAGELYIGGIGLSRGYCARPDLTADRFVPNPFGNGTRLYKTGDLARYLEDGEIEYLGRIDFQVKVRGFRIELGEIESVIVQHPDVKEVVVVVREDRQGDQRLVAYVVPVPSLAKEGRPRHHEDGPVPLVGADGVVRPSTDNRMLERTTPSTPAEEAAQHFINTLASEIRRFVKERLPENMVPSAVVVLEAMPLSPNGKIDRRALPVPEVSRAVSDEPMVLPRTAVEEQLAGIWSAVLGVKTIGVFDNFFELGGHSLLAMQVISRVRATFQIEIPLRELFETRTIAALADAVERAQRIALVPRITPVLREGELRLSYSQQGLWFLDQLAPGSAFYNLPIVVRLNGPVDLNALSRAFEEIVRRHESLRTRFLAVDGQPQQVISGAAGIPVSVVDLRQDLTVTRLVSDPLPPRAAVPLRRGDSELQLPSATPHGGAGEIQGKDSVPLTKGDSRGAERPAGGHSHRTAEDRDLEIRRIVAAEVQRPFDLARGPLIRTLLLRLADDDHVISVTMHHIVSDGWSLGVFVRELAALYSAFSAGLPSPLQPLPIQYADYAHWQRSWVQGEVLQEHLTYWKKQLEGVPVLELPIDHPRPAIRSFRGSMHRFEFSENVYASLQTLMKRHGVTLFMTCLAAFQAFLYRYTGQEDVVVGSPVANRNRTEVEGLIGFFVNTLVLRTNLSGNPNFREILSRVREITLGALAHQDLPFEKVVEALQPDRDLSRDALFQVLFVVQNAAPTMEPREGLTIELLESPTETAKFDLTLFIMEGEGTLSGALEYNTDLFEADSIRRMAENFTTFLAEAIADTERKLSEIQLLGSEEQAMRGGTGQVSRGREAVYLNELDRGPDADLTVLGAWNATGKEFSRNACIHELIEQQTVRTPDAIALVSGKGRLTYDELNRRANQLAHYLRVVGLGPQAIVGICMQRSIEMVISILGVLKAGAAYVPFDPAYPSERLAGMLEDAGVPLLLTEGRLIANLPPGNARLIGVDTDWEKIAQQPSENVNFNVTPDHRVYAIFTSGSTGRPKLAAVYHRGFVNLMEWFVRDFAIGEEDRTLLVSSFNFDLTQKNIYAPLMTGGCLYLADPGVFDPVAMRRTIQDDRITLLNCTPSAFYPLVDQANDQTLEQLQSLREVFLGGEPISLQRMSGWTKSPSFHAEIVNTYGPTECTDICAFYRIKDPVNFAGPIPIGRPIYNVGLYVLDANLAPLPIGVPGELCVAGEGVGQGYINDAELTARKFLPNPFGGRDGERLYRTGDLVRYLPSGDIEYLGRIDHQIKVRGFRIELGEIESVLRQHPSVKEAVVLAREDPPGEKWLAGYVVPRESPAGSAAHVSDADLRRYLRSRLPDYMVPSAFAVLEALPLSPNGKLDRKALPIPDRTQRRSATAYVAPSTPQETALANILAELLGTESVGIHDNFFELGGDSILAIQLIARAGRAGLRLSPAQIFQHQTIAELAAVAGVPVDITAEQGLVEGPVPLTPVQQRYFVFTEVDPHHFNHAFLLEVRTPLDADVLKAAVSQILTHHDALRMRFERDGENWRQRNAALDESPVDRVFVRRDLTGATESEQIRTVESESAELQGSLDLTHGPVMRVVYFDFGAARASRLLMIIHHLVVDGVSWRVLMADLLMAYQQLQRQQTVTLPVKTTSFRHWAERLPEYAKSEKLRQELDYWLSEKHARLQPMPVDFARRANTAANLGTVISSLTFEETRALLQDVPAAFRTQINDALLTALVAAFAEWTGQTSLLIELEGHGRENLFEDVDISRTVGWFTSLYPVCLELTDSKNAGNALRSVRRQLDRIPNRGVGYGLLRYLSDDPDVRRKLQSHPEPEITFNYHGQVDQTFAEDMSIVGAKESYGEVQSPRQTRSQLLDIVSGVSDGELKVAWTYNCDLHLRSTIERLAESFSKQLRALIAASRDPGAVEYKPADFPMAKLNQDQLNKILKKVSKPK